MNQCVLPGTETVALNLLKSRPVDERTKTAWNLLESRPVDEKTGKTALNLLKPWPVGKGKKQRTETAASNFLKPWP